ncbi:MAG: hypothetical protein JEY94_19210 [Melioribacteraceae bacterium]|nr:hypothetical protein [Melioribacteraceae bacterium]
MEALIIIACIIFIPLFWYFAIRTVYWIIFKGIPSWIKEWQNMSQEEKKEIFEGVGSELKEGLFAFLKRPFWM